MVQWSVVGIAQFRYAKETHLVKATVQTSLIFIQSLIYYKKCSCPYMRYIPDMTRYYGPSFRYRMDCTGGSFLNLPFGLELNLSKPEATQIEQVFKLPIFTINIKCKLKEICTICQDDINSRGRVRKLCGHEFHLDCFEQLVHWTSGKPDQCPNCLQQKELGQIVYFSFFSIH